MSFIDDVKSRLSNATPDMTEPLALRDRVLFDACADIAKLLELVQVYETALEQVKSVTGTSTLQWHAADKALTAGAKIKGDET